MEEIRSARSKNRPGWTRSRRSPARVNQIPNSTEKRELRIKENRRRPRNAAKAEDHLVSFEPL